MDPILNTPVSIKTKTWSRDSHGLYDYESRSLYTKTFPVCTVGTLSIQESQTYFSPEPFMAPNFQRLAQIQSSSLNYQISPIFPDCMWKVIKYLGPQRSGYQISVGDVLKLGRVKLEVKELVGLDPLEDSENALTQVSSDDDLDQPIVEEGLCRICQYEEEENDPLIVPCQCTGSLTYIHLRCLVAWLQTKVSCREQENSVTYYWKDMRCELCQSPYQYTQLIKGKKVQVFKSMNPIRPYVVFQSLAGDQKALYIVSLFNQFEARVGRGHESEIRISDISVSRFHATLSYAKGKFWLKDNNSKFGSLVQAKTPIDIQGKLYLQIGRTLVRIKPIDNQDNMWSLII